MTSITLVSIYILPITAHLGTICPMIAYKWPRWLASKVKFDIRFEIINLDYHDIDVHIASYSFLSPLRPWQPPNGLNSLRYQI